MTQILRFIIFLPPTNSFVGNYINELFPPLLFITFLHLWVPVAGSVAFPPFEIPRKVIRDRLLPKIFILIDFSRVHPYTS